MAVDRQDRGIAFPFGFRKTIERPGAGLRGKGTPQSRVREIIHGINTLKCYIIN